MTLNSGRSLYTSSETAHWSSLIQAEQAQRALRGHLQSASQSLILDSNRLLTMHMRRMGFDGTVYPSSTHLCLLIGWENKMAMHFASPLHNPNQIWNLSWNSLGRLALNLEIYCLCLPSAGISLKLNKLREDFPHSHPVLSFSYLTEVLSVSRAGSVS